MRMTQLVTRGLAMIAVSAAVLVGMAGTGSAAEGQVNAQANEAVIVNDGSGNGCMDLKSYSAGTPVTLYRCHGGTSQRFYLANDFTIRSIGSGYTQCLDVRSYANGAGVHLFTCHGGASQQWSLAGDRTIRSVGSGNRMCMDLTSYNNFTPVTLFQCHGDVSQRWGNRA